MYRDTRKQLLLERQENEKLRAENQKLQADVAYIAMMADVELDSEEDESNE